MEDRGNGVVRVPVESRFLGLDKRTFAGALAVAIVFLVFAAVMPRVNDRIPWNDPIAAGEELALTEHIAFAPAPGWNVEAGHRLSADGAISQSGDVTLTGAGVSFEMTSGDFEGTPAQLLAHAERAAAATSDQPLTAVGTASAVRTVDGQAGLLQPFVGLQTSGLIAAFVIDGVGVKISARGEDPQLQAAMPQISGMISSIREVDAKGTAQ